MAEAKKIAAENETAPGNKPEDMAVEATKKNGFAELEKLLQKHVEEGGNVKDDSFLNKMSAKAMKAKIMGQMDKHDKLRAKIAELRVLKVSYDAGDVHEGDRAEDDDGEVVVSNIDMKGRLIGRRTAPPAQLTRQEMRGGSRKGELCTKEMLRKKAEEDNPENAGRISLEEMVRDIKARGGASDMDETFAKNIMRLGGRNAVYSLLAKRNGPGALLPPTR